MKIFISIYFFSLWVTSVLLIFSSYEMNDPAHKYHTFILSHFSQRGGLLSQWCLTESLLSTLIKQRQHDMGNRFFLQQFWNQFFSHAPDCARDAKTYMGISVSSDQTTARCPPGPPAQALCGCCGHTELQQTDPGQFLSLWETKKVTQLYRVSHYPGTLEPLVIIHKRFYMAMSTIIIAIFKWEN